MARHHSDNVKDARQQQIRQALRFVTAPSLAREPISNKGLDGGGGRNSPVGQWADGRLLERSRCLERQ